MQCSSINKSYKCDKAACICISTGGKSCIYVCENENGDIMRCDDCKCLNYDKCQCQCDNSKCTCIITKGANTICVSHDGRGSIKACNCSCSEAKSAWCCEKKESMKLCECYINDLARDDCNNDCKCCKKKDFKTRFGEEHNVKPSSCCCFEVNDPGCCKKKQAFKSYEYCEKKMEKNICSGYCKCAQKKDVKDLRRVVSVSNNFKHDQTGCVWMSTGGKSCICVCENENGDIKRCDDCKCLNSGTYQCKCDGSKCTCIVTKGADSICVSRDGRGNIKGCNGSCIKAKNARCCEKKRNMKPSGCCVNELEKKDCGDNCKCNEKMDIKGMRGDERENTKARKCCCLEVDDEICCKKVLDFKSCDCCKKEPEEKACGSNNNFGGRNHYQKLRRAVTASKAGCVCIPTGGKSCVCVCENDNADVIRCAACRCLNSDNCQCKCDDNYKCTCIVTKGADIICVSHDGRGNMKACN